MCFCDRPLHDDARNGRGMFWRIILVTPLQGPNRPCSRTSLPFLPPPVLPSPYRCSSAPKQQRNHKLLPKKDIRLKMPVMFVGLQNIPALLGPLHHLLRLDSGYARPHGNHEPMPDKKERTLIIVSGWLLFLLFELNSTLACQNYTNVDTIHSS